MKAPPVLWDESPKAHFEIPVRNRLDHPVRFVDVQKSCACTEVVPPTNELQPGEEATVQMDVNVLGRFGEQTFFCTLIDQSKREWPCNVQVTVYPSTTFDPPNHLSVGPVALNTESKRTTEFSRYGRTREAVQGGCRFSVADPAVSLEVADSSIEELAGGVFVHRFPLSVQVKAGMVVGEFSSSVTASESETGQPLKSTLAVTWKVPGAFQATPARFFFTASGNTSAREQVVLVRRIDGAAFAVRKSNANHPAVQVTLNPQADGSQSVRVKIDSALALASTVWAEVSLEVDSPDQPTIRLPVAILGTSLTGSQQVSDSK